MGLRSQEMLKDEQEEDCRAWCQVYSEQTENLTTWSLSNCKQKVITRS